LVAHHLKYPDNTLMYIVRWLVVNRITTGQIDSGMLR